MPVAYTEEAGTNKYIYNLRIKKSLGTKQKRKIA